MSDESSRSARPSGQRHGEGAPAWWAALGRGDLPEDPPPTTTATWYDENSADVSLRDVAGAEGMPSRRRAWIINLTVVAIVALVIMLGVGTDSPSKALIAGLLFGVPLLLAVVTVVVIVRRSR